GLFLARSRPIPAQWGPRLSMTQGPTSLLPVWARTTARRPSSRRQSLHATTAEAMDGEEAHHR
uniref:Uncharacterized protein n=1 Tax=Aegilops tauschii subsp. strangulata TaxID=200361 RepID=A0A453P7H3_AEGTS